MPYRCHLQSLRDLSVFQTMSFALVDHRPLFACRCSSMLCLHTVCPVTLNPSLVFNARRCHSFFLLSITQNVIFPYYFNPTCGICLGFEFFEKRNGTVSTCVCHLRWWSDSNACCDCTVNTGNGCSKPSPSTILQDIKWYSWRGTSHPVMLLKGINRFKMSQGWAELVDHSC